MQNYLKTVVGNELLADIQAEQLRRGTSLAKTIAAMLQEYVDEHRGDVETRRQRDQDVERRLRVIEHHLKILPAPASYEPDPRNVADWQRRGFDPMTGLPPLDPVIGNGHTGRVYTATPPLPTVPVSRLAAEVGGELRMRSIEQIRDEVARGDHLRRPSLGVNGKHWPFEALLRMTPKPDELLMRNVAEEAERAGPAIDLFEDQAPPPSSE